MHLVTLTATMRRIYGDAAESSVADHFGGGVLGSGGEEEEEDFIAVVVKWSPRCSTRRIARSFVRC